MQALIYFIALPFIYLISILPFPALYLFSDFVCFIVFNCLGYRKTVVLQNLRNSFPEKTDKELKVIRRAFYYHLCDLFVETLKILTVSKKSIVKHCRFDPASLDLLNKYADEGKSIIMVMGHLGNWEWAGHPFSLLAKQRLVVLYHPLTNKYFDKFMLDMRGRFGTKMVPMLSAFKSMLAYRKEVTCTVFISDQTPIPENAYWTNFLHQDTPVFKGTETDCRKKHEHACDICRYEKRKKEDIMSCLRRHLLTTWRPPPTAK